MAGEVGLIGEAGVQRRVGEAGSLSDQPLGAVEPAHDQEAVRAGAGEAAELAGQLVAVEAGHRSSVSERTVSRAWASR